MPVRLWTISNWVSCAGALSAVTDFELRAAVFRPTFRDRDAIAPLGIHIFGVEIGVIVYMHIAVERF